MVTNLYNHNINFMTRIITLSLILFVNIISASAQNFLIKGTGLKVYSYNETSKSYSKFLGEETATIVYDINFTEKTIKMTTGKFGTKTAQISNIIKNQDNTIELIIESRYGDSDKIKIVVNPKLEKLHQ